MTGYGKSVLHPQQNDLLFYDTDCGTDIFRALPDTMDVSKLVQTTEALTLVLGRFYTGHDVAQLHRKAALP